MIKSIEEYLDAAPYNKEDFKKLDQWITQVAPELNRQLLDPTGQALIGYGELRQKNSKGKIWPLIGISHKSNYISMFVAAERDSIPLSQIYTTEQLGKVRLGKYSIALRKLKDVNLEVLEMLIKEAIAWDNDNKK